MALYLKSLNNGQKFYIISSVSSFSRNHFFPKIDYQIPLAKIQFDQIYQIWLI